MDREAAIKRERAFDLVLSAFVQGLGGGDEEFAEPGEVSSLSAEEAILRLPSRVRLGAKLRIAVHVPRTFFLEKPLEMTLSGTVVHVQPGLTRKCDQPIVRLRLDPSYAIQPRPA
jgi:hypothetical protein